MAKCKFIVGDRVVSNGEGYVKRGRVGRVVGIVNDNVVVVDFDDFHSGHNGRGYVSYDIKHGDDSCWLTLVTNISLSKDNTIVIYRNDNKVIALDKSTGERAEARCNPTDKFDFHFGARLAFDRLMGGKNEDIPKSAKEVKGVRRGAKVGEYVMIVEPIFSFGAYKAGEIGKVDRKLPSVDIVTIRGMDRAVCQAEYVVLENYQPEESEDYDDLDNETKKVGHMIKVLESEGGLSHCEAIDFVKDIALGRR